MKKLFTLFAAALMSAGMFADTVVTWDRDLLATLHLEAYDSYTDENGIRLIVEDGLFANCNFSEYNGHYSYNGILIFEVDAYYDPVTDYYEELYFDSIVITYNLDKQGHSGNFASPSYCSYQWKRNSTARTFTCIGKNGEAPGSYIYCDGYIYKITSIVFTIGSGAGGGTALHEVQSGKARSTKVLRDGKLFIERGGKLYNAQGAQIR